MKQSINFVRLRYFIIPWKVQDLFRTFAYLYLSLWISNYRYFVIKVIFIISTFQLRKIEKDHDTIQLYVGVLGFLKNCTYLQWGEIWSHERERERERKRVGEGTSKEFHVGKLWITSGIKVFLEAIQVFLGQNSGL